MDRSWAAILSGPERVRAGRFRFEADARRFVLGRLAIRRLLAGVSGLAPQSLDIAIGRFGKPVCPQLPAWSFNLSHSGDFVLVGASPQQPVGVDVERHTTPFPADIAPQLGQREAGLVARAPPEQAAALFYTFWTIKEAALKALGCGLAVPPAAVRLPGARGRDRWLAWQDCPWRVTQDGVRHVGLAVRIPVAQGYSAAIALLRPP